MSSFQLTPAQIDWTSEIPLRCRLVVLASLMLLLTNCAGHTTGNGTRSPDRADLREQVIRAALDAVPWDSDSGGVCSAALPCDTIAVDPRVLRGGDVEKPFNFWPHSMHTTFMLRPEFAANAELVGRRFELLATQRCTPRVGGPGPLPAKTVCVGAVVEDTFDPASAHTIVTLQVYGPGPHNYSYRQPYEIDVYRSADGTVEGDVRRRPDLP